jgi:hypothetical protein
MRRVADEQPDFTIFGGRIEPIWPREPPNWFFRVVPLGCTFAKTTDDLTNGPVPPLSVAGPNMAVRKCVFDAGYRFDETMGPQPGQYCMGSEVEFTTRLSRLGFRCYHYNASHVGHIVRPHQMEPAWIIKRANRFGKGMFRLQGGELSRGTRSLFGVPRWMVRRFVQELAKLITAKATGDFERRFAAAWQVQYYLGYLAEARHAGKKLRRPTARPRSISIDKFSKDKMT